MDAVFCLLWAAKGNVLATWKYAANFIGSRTSFVMFGTNSWAVIAAIPSKLGRVNI